MADRSTTLPDAPAGPTGSSSGRSRLHSLRAPLVLVAVAVLVGAVWAGWRLMHQGPQPLLELGFPDERALVTNELAHTHPGTPGVHTSPDWIVTSGSLFADHGTGWTGPVDAHTPDVDSRESTNSAVFRAVTRRSNLGDVKVSFELDVAGLRQVPGAKQHDYDGVHVMLRYASPQSLYYVSVCRRDGTAVIKKKTVANPSDDEGTYVALANARFPCTTGSWTPITVEARTTPSGVRLTFSTDGRTIVSAVDSGQGGTPPLRQPGRVGLRGDNTEFHFRNFRVLAAGS